MKGLKTLSEEVFEEINSYTAEQYESFCNDFAAASDIDIADVEKNIAEYEEKIASETDEGEKAKLEEKLSAQNELKETYYKNSIVVKILSSEQYQTAIELSLKLYELL